MVTFRNHRLALCLVQLSEDNVSCNDRCPSFLPPPGFLTTEESQFTCVIQQVHQLWVGTYPLSLPSQIFFADL